jgi:signal transduction histidine kinase
MASHEQLIRAVQLATRMLAKTGNIDSLLKNVLQICVRAVEAHGGTIYLHDPATSKLRFQHVLPESVLDKLPMRDIPDSYGQAGQAFQSRVTLRQEFEVDASHKRTEFEEATGVVLRSMITVPLMLEDEEPIGVVQMINKRGGPFSDSDVSVMDTVAAVSTMALLNSRLMEERNRASTLLGMGKVSHDIGNLAASLHATLSTTGFFHEEIHDAITAGDLPAVQKALPELFGILNDMGGSVDMIVGYSRLISDLSAGRELRPTKVLSTVGQRIEEAASYFESEARSNHIQLHYATDLTAPAVLHDPLYINRIVQNLVGNAIKAVKETISTEQLAALDEDDDTVLGSVSVRYSFEGHCHILEVCDTGPGMSAETVQKLLAKAGVSNWSNSGGSGWGMKIVIELAATHDAKLEIDSTIGKGSTFRISIPHCEHAELSAVN